MLKFLRIAILIISTGFAASIIAADAPNLQNTVEMFDPGRTATDISEPDLTKSVTPPPNVVNIKSKEAPVVDEATAPAIKFRLKKIILIGNTVFSNEELAKLYADKLDTDVSLADLDQIAQQITEYYRSAGYILSQAIIPPQQIDSAGIVKIKIIEGYINKISVTGCKSDNVCALLQDYGEHITRKAPLQLASLERYSFLANDIPGVKARAVLTRSQELTGAADLTFIVEEQQVGGSFTYNNYNSTVLGRQQFIANAHVNNLTLASETAINGIAASHFTRMRYASFTHKQQFNSNGWGGRLLISNIDTNPNMGTVGIGGVDIPGTAFICNLSTDYAWLRSHSKNFNIGAGFKYLNSSTEFAELTLFKDNIRSLNVYGAYNFMSSANTYNNIVLTYTQGLNIFNAQRNPPSRVGETLTFSKFDIYASSSHRFTRTRFTSLLAFKAQYAFNTVPSSETFSYGGVPFGYGYEPAEFSGDRGLAGLLELQYPGYTIHKMKLFSQFFGFFDFGYAWDINKTVQPTSQYGASTGLGHRVNMYKHVNMDFIVAAPLKPSTVEGTPNYVRVLFNIKFYV